MKKWMGACMWVLVASLASQWATGSDLSPEKMKEIAKENGLSQQRAAALEKALGNAKWLTQGGAVSIHPKKREQCKLEVIDGGKLKGGASDVGHCGYPNMAVVPSTAGAPKVCIDRYEFPNIPCDYPATWTQADQAAAICQSMGKRLCDAHEWEGACSGEAQPQDWQHPGNSARKKTWAYGPKRDASLCAFGQPKSPGCDKAIEANKNVKEVCTPNTWPSGSFPQCAGELGVYDLHGNAAEHMNLARSESESGPKGGRGVTEMKGSWFVFPNSGERVLHEDDCVWRAPGWHRTDTMSPGSHANYHLGFRCCADVR
jgi:hypothetical protein